MGIPAAPPPPLTYQGNLDRALNDLATALNAINGFRWGLHGSSAARIHGAVVVPGDIDVVVTQLQPAVHAIVGSGHFTATHGRGGGIQAFRHTATGTLVELADAQDFLPHFQTVTVGQVHVFTLAETIISLLLRPVRREKEIKAFAYLTLAKGNLLGTQEKERIAQTVERVKRRDGMLRGAATVTWQDVLTDAHAAAKHFHMAVGLSS